MQYVKKNQVIAIIHWNSLKVRFICAQWYNVDVPIWVLTSGPFYNHGRKNRYFSGIIHLFLNQILKLGHGCATSTSRTRSSEQAPIPGFLLPILLRNFLVIIECKWCVSRALLFIYSFRKSHWAVFLWNCFGPAQKLMEFSYTCLKLIPLWYVEELFTGHLLSP